MYELEGVANSFWESFFFFFVVYVLMMTKTKLQHQGTTTATNVENGRTEFLSPFVPVPANA